MSENWMILGYESDPVPGDPGVVRKFAADYAGVAQAIADASTRLRSIADRQIRRASSSPSFAVRPARSLPTSTRRTSATPV
jgi:hypothetical protein